MVGSNVRSLVCGVLWGVAGAVSAESADAGGTFDAPALLQTGGAVESTLDEGDTRVDHGRYGEYYRVRAEPGVSLRVQVRAIDARVHIGVRRRSRLGPLVGKPAVADPGAVTSLHLEDGKEYFIVVVGDMPGQGGRYRLSVQDAASAAVAMADGEPWGEAATIDAQASAGHGPAPAEPENEEGRQGSDAALPAPAVSVDAGAGVAGAQEPESLAAGARASIASTPGQPVDAAAANAAVALQEPGHTGWGAMERLAGREWEWRIDVWRQARSFTWKVPGRVLVEGDGSTYELLDDGTIVFTTPSSDGPVTYSFTVNADGTWQRHVDPDPSVLQYIRAEDKRRLEIWRAEPSGQISIWSKHPDDPYPRLQSILLPADGSGGNEIRIGRQLGAPAEWGPMARLANRTTGDPSVGQHIVHVPGADGNVLYSAYPGFDGHPSRGAWLIRRMGDGTFVRHTATRGSRQVRIGVVVDASTVRWYLPGRAEPEQDWIFREENLGARDLVLEVLAHDPALANFTQPVRTYLYPHGVLREGLAEIAALDVDLSGKVQRIAQKYIEDHTHQDMTNPWARVLYDGLSGGLEVARASEARSRATLDATLAQVRAQAAAGAVGTQRPATSAGGPATNGAGAPVSGGQHAAGDSVSVQGVAGPAGQAATGTASPAAAQPLRFVLMIGMRNLPGDARNPTCYSNVITRPGPPGWGVRGSLPSGSAEQALREIDALKGAFIAACRASGREITSEGSFRHVRNQLAGDEERVSTTGPRFPEDVAVVLH